MTKESERTYIMKENFMMLHQQGLSISEIADRYNLSKITVYRHLQEIADKNGVTRESLLKVVKVPTPRQYKAEEARVKVGIEELKLGFKEVDTGISNLIAKIDEIIKEDF